MAHEGKGVVYAALVANPLIAIAGLIDEIERRLRSELPHLRRIWIEPGTIESEGTAPATSPARQAGTD